MSEEAEGAQSIVEGDDDGTFLRESRTVVAFLAAESSPETAAVNPNQDGVRIRARVERARVDVQIKTIFRHTSRERIDIRVRLMLHAVVTQLRCRANALPGRRGLRWSPAQCPHWR